MERYFQSNKDVDGVCKCKRTSEKFSKAGQRRTTSALKSEQVPRKTSAPVFSKRTMGKMPDRESQFKSKKTQSRCDEEVERVLCKATSELNLKRVGNENGRSESSQISFKNQSIQTLSEHDMDDIYANGIIR